LLKRSLDAPPCDTAVIGSLGFSKPLLIELSRFAAVPSEPLHG
jgi:hypothetical protein